MVSKSYLFAKAAEAEAQKGAVEAKKAAIEAKKAADEKESLIVPALLKSATWNQFRGNMAGSGFCQADLGEIWRNRQSYAKNILHSLKVAKSWNEFQTLTAGTGIPKATLGTIWKKGAATRANAAEKTYTCTYTPIVPRSIKDTDEVLPGSAIMYQITGGEWEKANVLKIHYDDIIPYFTVRIEKTGRERQVSDRRRMRLI